MSAVEQRRDRNRTGAVPALEERHRSHPHPREPSGTGVPGDVVGRNRGAGQDELARLPTRIHRPPHVVPDRGHDLPFIDEPGRFPGENQGRLDVGCSASLLVDVEQDDARRECFGSRGLSASLRPFDDDGPGRCQPKPQFRFDDAVFVRDRHCVILVGR